MSVMELSHTLWNPYDVCAVNGNTPPVTYQMFLHIIDAFGPPEDFNLRLEATNVSIGWCGDERAHGHKALRNGILPNYGNPDLLELPIYVSVALRFGCLSVRRFCWSVHDLFNATRENEFIRSPFDYHFTTQLLWREYCYTMSVVNPYFAETKRNPIFLDMPFYEDNTLKNWNMCRTGFTLIDAAMRQLHSKNWIHHTLGIAVALPSVE